MQWTRLAVPALLMLSGCGQSSHDTATSGPSSAEATDAPIAAPVSQSTPVAAASMPTPVASTPSDTGTDAGGSGSVSRDCTFVVDGKTQVKGQCLVYPMGGNGYTLNTWSKGKPKQSHFAVVSANPDGTATATWNADPNDDRAGDPLGTVHFVKGCWTNKRTQICAR